MFLFFCTSSIGSRSNVDDADVLAVVVSVDMVELAVQQYAVHGQIRLADEGMILAAHAHLGKELNNETVSESCTRNIQTSFS